ncbi:hypothetical protein K1T71_002922 [Dendrolimus kikuchii]|uniref:Uncharacterized protein n=1 Tax=Dendrolimus kikuchii TaxID=765133 RepID=A0ACC1DB71_9NEOP|nr:hypothetical protein K1T71_002922 [Dendrolimus kikuchii]
MAKRANPFTEDFIPQSKIYIGLKQFNNNEHRLKKVYEKTLELLFKGAKKTSQANDVVSTGDTNSLKKDKMKQLFIGKDGSLLHTGNMIENKSPAKLCNCSGVFDCQCAYCDKVLCGACQHQCTKCDNTYCSHCMLLGSDGADICVSCYD